MEEKERVAEKLRWYAESEEEKRQLLALLEDACRGLEEGVISGVESELKGRLDRLMQEVEASAREVERMI